MPRLSQGLQQTLQVPATPHAVELPIITVLQWYRVWWYSMCGDHGSKSLLCKFKLTNNQAQPVNMLLQLLLHQVENEYPAVPDYTIGLIANFTLQSITPPAQLRW